METHSSILVWRIPWTEEPRGLQTIASHRVRHNCSNLAHTHTLNITDLLGKLVNIYVKYLA